MNTLVMFCFGTSWDVFLATLRGLCTGVRWRSYGENPHLKDFFNVLSLSADRDQGIYISTIEAYNVSQLCQPLLVKLLQ